MVASWHPPRYGPRRRDEPGDDIRDLLRRQRRGTAVPPPIRHSKIRAPRDDGRPQVLIAHEREVRRIGDATASRTAPPAVAVAAGAGAGEDSATTVDIAARRSSPVIGRNLAP